MTRPTRHADAAAPRRQVTGLAAAVLAYLSWGMFPLFFKAIDQVPPLEILAHRVVWSAAFLAVLVSASRRWRDVAAVITGGRVPVYLVTTLLIAANWLLYIWAVNSDHVLEASLGYFINPLVNVALGVVFLREALTGRQKVAVALAAAGVLTLAVWAGTVPWISLSLALSFGLYGFVRKRARIDAVVGLFVETALLAPLALGLLAVLAARGTGSFGAGVVTTTLLASAGVVTALPLIWFAIGVRSLRYTTMGLIQYLSPTGQFMLAVGLYGERFTPAHAVTFACIWASLALYSWEALVAARRPPSLTPALAPLDRPPVVPSARGP